jgi:hypothetical protein
MLLKEALEDLEWPSGGGPKASVHLLMEQHPKRATLSASGAGDLQVGLSVCRWCPRAPEKPDRNLDAVPNG